MENSILILGCRVVAIPLFLICGLFASAAPTITINPTSQTVPLGATLKFVAAAQEDVGLTWQWNYMNQPLPGATNPILTLQNIQYADAGPYTAVATDFSGSATSAVANLWVKAPPGFTWAQSVSSSSYARAVEVAVDASGNSYLGGIFRPDAILGTNVLNSSSLDPFIAKFDSFGDPIWIRSVGSTNVDYLDSIAVDATGNVLLVGRFTSEATFGNVILSPIGSEDAFVAKFDSEGSVLWATNFGGTTEAAAIGADGSVYLAGHFEGTAQIAGQSLTSAGNKDVFVCRMTPGGLPVWVRQFGGTNSDVLNTMALDSSNHLVLGGSYSSPVFQADAFSIPNHGSTDGFIAKMTSAGTVMWLTGSIGVGSESVLALAIDHVDNIGITGRYSDVIGFGNVLSASIGGADMFVAKCLADGTVLWLRSGGGTTADRGLGIAADPSGNFHVTGQFSPHANFGNLTHSSSHQDALIVSYTGNGHPFALHTGGSPWNDIGWSLAADSSGGLYLGAEVAAGSFGHTSTPAGAAIAKLQLWDSSAPPIFAVTNAQSRAVPSGIILVVDMPILGQPPFNFRWYRNGIAVEGQNDSTLSLSNVVESSSGDYTLVVSNSYGTATSSVVSVTVEGNPDFIWARSCSGQSNEVALTTTVDWLGNAYTAGYFTGTARFRDSQLVSAGGEDIFVTKHNSTGNLLWAKRYGGIGNDRATAIIAGSKIYMAGSYEGSVSFDSASLTNAGQSDVFVCNLNENGIVVWAARGGGPNSDVATGLAQDPSPIAAFPVFVTGWFQTNATFGSTTLSDSTASNKVFVAKMGTTNFAWARKSEGTGPSKGTALAAYQYTASVVGKFSGTVQFGTNSFSTPNQSGFIARYDANGTVFSSRGMGVALSGQPVYSLEPNAAVRDRYGNLVIAGAFNGTVSFDGTNVITSVTPSASDVFVAKFSGSNAFMWASTAGGTGNDSAQTLVLDVAENPIVAGHFSDRAWFGNSKLDSAGGRDVFVAAWDSFGQIVNVRRAGGTGDDLAFGISNDNDRNIFVAGSCSAAAVFGSHMLTNTGGSDVFLTKLSIVPGFTPPLLATKPQSQTVVTNNSVLLRVGALDSWPIGNGPQFPVYRWQLNGTDLPGTHSNQFRIQNTRLGQLGDYRVVVSGTRGNSTSEVARVTFELPSDFLWINKAGTGGEEQAYGVAVDTNRNALYVCGHFSGNNGSLGNLISSGGTDVFVARYDLNGQLVWARAAGGVLTDSALGLTIDSSGNVLVTGHFFSSTATFGGATLTNHSLSTSYSDLFIAKYDPDGNLLWAKSGGGAANAPNRSDVGTAVTTDPSGNIYLSGSYHWSASIGGILVSNSNFTNFFLAKLDALGNGLWVKSVIGTNTSQGNGIAVDAATNIWATGSFMRSADFGHGILTITNNTFWNGAPFLARYTHDGELIWARKAAGQTGAGALAADNFGYVYATSYKSDFDSGVFLTKYDSSGNSVWLRNASVYCCSGDYVAGNGLAVDGFGNPVVVGFGNGSIQGFTNNLPSGGYILKYRHDGSGYWVQRCGSSGNAVALDNAGNAYVAGRLTGTSFFGTSNLVSSGGNDIFVAKVGVRPPTLGLNLEMRTVTNGAGVLLTATSTGTGPLFYQWQLNGTNIPGATNLNLNLSSLSWNKAGVYSLVVSNLTGANASVRAIINVAATLELQQMNNFFQLTWQGPFTLQSTETLNQDFEDVMDATNPHPLDPATAGSQLFRLRGEPLSVQTTTDPDGSVWLHGSGGPGYAVYIQSSTNAIDWTTISTNGPGFSLKVTDGPPLPGQTFRAILAF